MTPASNTPSGPEKLLQRDMLLAEVYTPEGCKLWLAHAEKHGWDLDEQIARLTQLAEGVFA